MNNLVPWATKDKCMGWTWYLANDFQFYLLVPLFVKLYYSKRRIFYVLLGVLVLVSISVQMVVIMANNFSPSYLTYNDEYWTLFYVKPWSRFN